MEHLGDVGDGMLPGAIELSGLVDDRSEGLLSSQRPGSDPRTGTARRRPSRLPSRSMQVARVVVLNHVHDCAHGVVQVGDPVIPNSLGVKGGLAVTTSHVGDTRSPHFFDPDAGRRIWDNGQKGACTWA